MCSTTTAVSPPPAPWQRREQQVKWMWALVEERLHGRLAADPRLKVRVPELEAAVAGGALSPTLAADEIVETLGL
jgi:LAO/AO transport system kinase